MRKRGFTVVELVVVITILGILITLASVKLNSSIANARDSERKTDIETIALSLEKYYNSNNNQYPSTNKLSNDDEIKKTFPDIDEKSLSAPDYEGISFKAATDQNPIETLSKDEYIYQPFDKNGDLCNDSGTDHECRRFVLYCFLEVSNSVYSVESKNQ